MTNLRVDKITSTETFETTGSVQFDGSGDRLSVADNADFGFGSGDFTIEYWIYHSQTGSRCHPFDLRSSGDEDSVTVFYAGNTTELRIYFNGSDKMNLLTELQPSQWVHHALVRNGDILTFYQNGIRLDSAGVGGESLRTSAPAVIGAKRDGSEVLNGHISNFRIVKGTALYTSNFKPSMRELEVVPGTVLLTCQSKTDASLEKTDKTITVTGNAVANELTPGLLTPVVKSGGGSAITGSVEFTGSPSRLTADSVDFAMGSNDLTMECWFYNGVDTITHLVQIDVDGGATNFSLATRDAAAGDVRFLVRNDSGDNLSDLITGAPRAKINMWHHLAGTIEGTTTRLFLNGILIASGTLSGTRTHTGQRLNIGANKTSRYLKGYMSNVRIVKGTALYTADFIPPTRELKKVPGTVLLCCQDPDSPLTEATGKTITGYGDLRRTDGSELVTNGDFSNGTTGWTISDAGEGSMAVVSGQLVVTNDDTSDPPVYAWQEITTVAGNRYRVGFQLVGGTASSTAIYLNSASSFGDAYGQRATSGTNSLTVGALGELEFVAAGTTAYILLRVNANEAATSIFDNISAYTIPHDTDAPASNFTPQVGDDRQITFEGVTKINTDAYFYLPTGNTITRDGGASTRGIIGGGDGAINSMQYVTIASTGDALDFGDLEVGVDWPGAVGSKTRGAFAGGRTPSNVDHIQYITISSLGNSKDFGDITVARRELSGCSDSTRGCYGGGTLGSKDEIDFITIASTGNAQDFGNLIQALDGAASYSSPTRGIWAGGEGPSPYPGLNIIHYITIASKGNAQDFGDLTVSKWAVFGCSNTIRGLTAGNGNVISYITIASTGNAQDFGDLQPGVHSGAAFSSNIRGVFASAGPSAKHMGFVNISTSGNNIDFGDALVNTYRSAGLSNGHGGLG